MNETKTTAIATRTETAKMVPAPFFTREKVDLIKRTVAKGATDDELQLFLHQCERTGLDPLARQIYFRKQKSKNGDQMTIITGIDGYRLTADRTGKYGGNDDPVFDDEDSPRKATVTVYKIIGGLRCPFTSSARWDQYYPGDTQGFMWRKMPHLMLGKCAEALALRKAFPAELSGIYTQEEMEQAGAHVVEAPPEQGGVPEQPQHQDEVINDRGDPFDSKNAQHKTWLRNILRAKNIIGDDSLRILELMQGRYEDELEEVINGYLTKSAGFV